MQGFISKDARKENYKAYLFETLKNSGESFTKEELMNLTKLDETSIDEILGELMGIMIQTETLYKAIL